MKKTNRAIAIDHVTLNMYKHPIKSCLTRTPPERNFIENEFANRKLEKAGWSVPPAPVYKTSKKTDKVIPTCLFMQMTVFHFIFKENGKSEAAFQHF
jgi:hypothetical protein